MTFQLELIKNIKTEYVTKKNRIFNNHWSKKGFFSPSRLRQKRFQSRDSEILYSILVTHQFSREKKNKSKFNVIRKIKKKVRSRSALKRF